MSKHFCADFDKTVYMMRYKNAKKIIRSPLHLNYQTFYVDLLKVQYVDGMNYWVDG